MYLIQLSLGVVNDSGWVMRGGVVPRPRRLRLAASRRFVQRRRFHQLSAELFDFAHVTLGRAIGDLFGGWKSIGVLLDIYSIIIKRIY